MSKHSERIPRPLSLPDVSLLFSLLIIPSLCGKATETPYCHCKYAICSSLALYGLIVWWDFMHTCRTRNCSLLSSLLCASTQNLFALVGWNCEWSLNLFNHLLPCYRSRTVLSGWNLQSTSVLSVRQRAHICVCVCVFVCRLEVLGQ